jgi:NADPH-dependent 2,4-dienoyl-CoA reductase/sulfur reductase-like enzyme
LLQKLVRRITINNGRWAGANSWTEEKDLVIIGGGVAGYVAAIKAGQAGLKVQKPNLWA